MLGTRRAGVGGFHVFGPGPAVEKLGDLLAGVGLPLLGDLAAESLRIEAGVPRFGVDMTEDTIPLEAGIEPRAISFTKGCYVGQEVNIRVMHRGHGRVARRLVLLHVSGGVPERGSAVVDGDREIGSVTSAVRSPRFGPVALGYVHRDYVADGTKVEIQADGGRLEAVVAGRSGGETTAAPTNA